MKLEEKEEEKKEETDPCPEKQSINFTFPSDSGERDLRTVALFGNINEEKSAEICSSLYYLWMNTPDPIPEELLEEGEEQPETDIRMFISTFGGDAVEMFGIYDMMRVVKSDDVDIRTIGTGKVMSAGVLLMAAGTKGKRRITKHCRVMLHQVSAGTFGTLNNMETELEEVKVIQDMYIQAIADNSNLSVKQIKKLFKTHANVYLSAEEAVEYGLADTIV
jgi:ATP-dependent Clp protease protease subunit